MRRAIFEYGIIGIRTTLPLHHAIMNNRHFIEGNTHTHFLLEEHVKANLARYLQEEEARMQTLAHSLRHGREAAAIATAVNVYIAAQKQRNNVQ